MHIFIDESGPFVAEATRRHSVSTVGSLVVPTSSMRGFEKLYGRLRKRLPKTKGVVKGRRLSEDHLVEVSEGLRKVGCIFEVVAIDVGLHAEDEVRYHRQQQAERG